ncbi:50S ribosomal protein L5 [bacterium]|jgi:large subunit ribosomal protein L5|nr:50S ribosomal protein L5 [bacterium]
MIENITQAQIAKELQKDLGLSNPHQTPKITKVIVAAGIGTLAQKDKKVVKEVVANLTLIAGQKPVVNKARLSISNFKLREGMPVGVSATLRGKRANDFLNNLINIVFPRVRDFRGFSRKSMDGNGNISIGIKEHLVFPEINPDDLVTIHGLQVVIQTSATNDEQGYALLRKYNFPFKEKTN